jgi:hypothetical protein
MKVSAVLSITAVVIGLTSAGLAANYDDLAATGYRWVTIDARTVVLLTTICSRSLKND